MFYKEFFYNCTFLTTVAKSFPSFIASPKCGVIDRVCTYVCRRTCLCIGMWGTEVDTGYHSPLDFFEARSPTEPGAHAVPSGKKTLP